MPRLKKATRKLLVIQLDMLFLAFPLEAVQKVMRTPEIFKGSTPVLGITHVEGADVMVLDLHQRIYGQANPQPEDYLVILKAPEVGLYGIPAATLPSIKEVAVSQLNPLPAEYRERDSLGAASHSIVLESGEAIQTIFLMDMGQLITFMSAATINVEVAG